MGDVPIQAAGDSAPQQATVAGVVAILGLFAGLCAIFALVATLVDWRDERARARWPVTTARIDHGSVEAVHDSRNERGSTRWRLVYRVRYEIAGQGQKATLATPSTQSTDEAARMEAWVASHRRGREISIRYDPAKPQDVAFASGDVPGTRPRVTTDLQLLAIAAIACAVLLPLGRFFGMKEARAPRTGALSRGGSIGFGVMCAAIGFLEIGLGLHAAMEATQPLTSEDFIVVPAGLIFVFGGVLLGLSPAREGLMRVFAALLISAFAITFDWIAFGPGERHFSGGISLGVGAGFDPGEWLGRAVFGIPAAIATAVAAVMWTRLLKARFFDPE